MNCIPAKICVYGLWHLGSVISGCLASLGFDVTGLDNDASVVDRLNLAHSPISEPGLNKIIADGICNFKLNFTTNISEVSHVELLWVTFDTPVDENDIADVDFVINNLKNVIQQLPQKSIVLISSQLPVGSVSKVEEYAKSIDRDDIEFSYSPENLRLGKAVDLFLRPDRLIVGVRNDSVKNRLGAILSLITTNIIWMSVESAEMTKHAINSFLAVSITFANEIASICELVGADAKQVEQGLRTEQRIGPLAYLSPGTAFSGGTLARDIAFMSVVAADNQISIPLLSAVKLSNDFHKDWVKRRLLYKFGNLLGKVITVWGLTYKPGTDTLRRSLSVEFCNWLISEGAVLHVHDPAVKELPVKWEGVIRYSSLKESLSGSTALVISTQWPEYRAFNLSDFEGLQTGFVVVDPNRFLYSLAHLSNIEYLSVGSSNKSL